MNISEVAMTHAVAATIDDTVALSPDACWDAVIRKDAAADGRFYYSVRTTGVYCRPSCGARLPRRENVDFHRTPQDAERAGFRACKRCRPNQLPRAVEAVVSACRAIESTAQAPDLASLARAAGMSAFHFHRVFKSLTGMTPKAYVTAHRAAKLRVALPQMPRVTDAIYEAGFGSSGRFYASSANALGMSPRAYRAGGGAETIRFAVAQCSLGAVLVAATARGVCAILLGDEPDVLLDDLQKRFPRANLIGGDAAFESTVAQVIALVEAPGQARELPLDIRGTAFQEKVWRALREIPAGQTVSYSDLAARLGMPKAARAVAAACAANPLAIAVPCHRVVRRDGDAAGYRWGIDRKVRLLAREKADE